MGETVQLREGDKEEEVSDSPEEDKKKGKKKKKKKKKEGKSKEEAKEKEKGDKVKLGGRGAARKGLSALFQGTGLDPSPKNRKKLKRKVRKKMKKEKGAPKRKERFWRTDPRYRSWRSIAQVC